jgi:protein-disulfide isomerase
VTFEIATPVDAADHLRGSGRGPQLVVYLDPATSARVERDMASGDESGVDGTPSIFIDGRRYRGQRDPEGLVEALGLPRPGD